MKCEATGCNDDAKYTKNVTIADSFDVEVQLCQMHYLIDPYCTYRTDEELKRILDNAVMAPSILD